jgi:hypothetical protein
MSQNKSVAQAQAVLNTARGVSMSSWTPWVGPCFGDPRVDGVEVGYGGYARLSPTFAAPIGSAQYIASSSEVLFAAPAAVDVPTDPADWIGVWDAVTGGVLRYALLLQSPLIFVVARSPRLAIGAIVLGEL